MEIDPKHLGLAVREMRLARGMTQIELARAAGMSASGNTIAVIERGERGISLRTMNQIAKALQLPAGCLSILASRTQSGDKDLIRLLKSMQKLVRTVVAAQQSAGVGAPKSSERRRRLAKAGADH